MKEIPRKCVRNSSWGWKLGCSKYVEDTIVESKVKWSRYRHGVAQRVGRGVALLFHDRGTRRRWEVRSTPRPHFSPRERSGTQFTGGWEGPQGRSGRAENLVPTGIRSHKVHPVAQSLYRLSTWAQNWIKIYVKWGILNILAPELFLSILAHPVYKMWIIQEPNTLEV